MPFRTVVAVKVTGLNRFCALILPALLFTLLSGCSEAPQTQRPQSAGVIRAVRQVPDPAMEQQTVRDMQSTVAVTGDPTLQSQEDPDRFTVDQQKNRVFIPGKGWIDAATFWDIYFTNPQELPEEMDHLALHSLRPGGNDERSITR